MEAPPWWSTHGTAMVSALAVNLRYSALLILRRPAWHFLSLGIVVVPDADAIVPPMAFACSMAAIYQ